jgi:hypothetical protein
MVASSADLVAVAAAVAAELQRLPLRKLPMLAGFDVSGYGQHGRPGPNVTLQLTASAVPDPRSTWDAVTAWAQALPGARVEASVYADGSWLLAAVTEELAAASVDVWSTVPPEEMPGPRVERAASSVELAAEFARRVGVEVLDAG